VPADLPTLKRMTIEAFDGVSIDQGIERVHGEIHGHNWQWRKARHLDDDLRRDPHGIFVLAGGSNEPLGYVSTWCDRDAGIGHVPNVVVDASVRGQGWGRKLLEYALEHFRQAGLTHAKIETLAQNAVGNHLYQDLGFVEVARQVHFVARLGEREVDSP
ncbi:MAG: GNAT family N-acetyltransferase, partial [Planctomycetota bacterium]|nr:GNAT family N-acetyltransferase [Planctomycetota bacterium]